ncbi:sensor histidine kinase [Macrococcus caseolyticus]|uniref:sensor histidine kinase n=1 Tax=Macrococcoides caseolyticum TaxID=69966 RepID=UPI0024BD4BA7|nr:sensor histidine kinase [Macrococcus caseolyticus]MDJ1091498.1 sensor histidine kinase [Macrococcus caseolyticus]MDJ1153424.1 sensor histidine kinase [Macrococcus caseolyticus]
MSKLEREVNDDGLVDAFYNDTDELIIFIDEKNNILTMNQAAQKVIDLHDNIDCLTRNLCRTCLGVTSENAIMECRDCFIKREQNNQSFQLFLKDENGEPKPYSASYVVLKENNGTKVLTLQNISQQIKTQEILHQKTITQKIISAQENERKRISRELHDSVIQELLNVSVDIRLMKYKTEEEKEKHLQMMEGSIARLMDDIRNLSLELRPSSLDDLGLVAAFNSHFKQLEKSYGLEVNMDEDIGNIRFSNEIETAVYRITQEAILNALKYANVDEVNVFIQKDETELTVEISDSGDGFTPGDTPKGSGLGFFGMQERAAIVNGHVEINSETGKGTFVTLTIPL